MQTGKNATVDDDAVSLATRAATPVAEARQGSDTDIPPRPNAAQRKEAMSKENAVHFKDAVGRTFLFPYEEVRTWDGMETAIQRAFSHVDVVGQQVRMGHYDLLEDDNIILPQFWKYSVRPGSRFIMKLWPPSKPKPQVPQGFPGAHSVPRAPSRHAGLPGQHPTAPSFWPPAGGAPPLAEVPVNVVDVEPRPQQGSFLRWVKKKSTKKQQDPSTAVSKVSAAPRPKPGLLASLAAKPRAQHGPARVSSIRNESRESSVEVIEEAASSSGSSGSTVSEENVANPARKFVVDEQAVFSLKMSKDDINEMESKVQRQPTFHGLGRSLEHLDCLRLSSARIIGHDGTEPLELVRANCASTLNNRGKQSTSSDMTWIHVQRHHMDFGEFENIAHFELTRDVALRNAIGLLLRAVRDKKWDEDWHIKPGTVLRCDIHSEDKDGDLVDLSPIFASVPNVHVAKFNRKLARDQNRAYCPPRRLHEAFGHLDRMAAHDKMQQFRQHEGAKTEEILWGGQTWILVTKAGLVTYGDASRAQLEGDSITLTDSGTSTDGATKIVQLMDSQNRLSFAPLDHCRSFFELQGVVLVHARGILGDEVNTATVLRLQTAQGDELTAGKWSNLLRGEEIPMIRWHLEDPESSEPDSSSSSEGESSAGSPKHGSSDRRKSKGQGKFSATSSRRGRSRGRKTSKSPRASSRSQSRSRRRSRSTMSSLRSQSSSSQVSSTASTPDHDDDDINFLAPNLAKTQAEDEEAGVLGIPEPEHRVPPFLSWMPSDSELSKSGDALMQRLTMAEAGIIRTPKRPHRDALIEGSYQAFSQDDVFAEAKPQSFKDFEYRRKSFKVGGSRLRLFKGGRSRQGDGEKMTSLAENLLDMCVRVLEAFAPKDLPALSVTHCFGALSSVLQDPTATAALKDRDEADASDPDSDVAPTSDKAGRWVVSLRAETELVHPGHARCEDCSKGKVYKNTSKAIAHLRRSHAVGLRADIHLREYVSTIREVSKERLKRDYREILLRCRKGMARIAQKTARIQAGVIYQSGFKGPAAGLPPPLFKAFKLLVVFLCALPRLLDNVSWLYKVEVFRPRVRQMSSSKVDAQRQAVYKLGEAVEGQVHDAERVLASPELSSEKVEGLMKGRLMDVVGPSYVALQIIHNILRVPVYGGKHVAELYDGCFRIQQSQFRRRPEKRLVLSIGALRDEMSLVSNFLSTQIKAVAVIAAVLSPSSRTLPDADAEAAFEQLEAQVFDRVNWHLAKQLEDLERIDKTLKDMDGEVRQRAEIMADQNSRAMMIFTVVTVFFLPPGFVAAYLSMGDGPDGLDFGGIQRRFWTIAGPLTAAVWAVCIFLAFEGTENSPLDKARAALGKRRAEREERGTAEVEDYASVGEISV